VYVPAISRGVRSAGVGIRAAADSEADERKGPNVMSGHARVRVSVSNEGYAAGRLIGRVLIFWEASECVCECVQDRSEPQNKDYSVQRLLLGTHTSEGEQNYLMRAQVQLPLEDTETDARQYDEERGEMGGFGAAAGKVQVCAPLKMSLWQLTTPRAVVGATKGCWRGAGALG
jgi:hypothetical protein